MRRKLIGIVSAVFVVWAGLSVLSQNQVRAAEKKEKHGELEALKDAHKLLTEADHDYDGHRAKAAEEVHKAIEELEHHHAHKRVAEAAAPGTGAPAPVVAKIEKVEKKEKPEAHAKPDEPQPESDAQLHKALKILEEVAEHMKGHHPEAEHNVKNAIEELHTALKIK